MSSTISSFGRLAIGTAGSAVTARLDHQSFATGTEEQFVDASGNTGRLTRFINRQRLTKIVVAPALSLKPTSAELALVLPWLLGGTPTVATTTTTYPLGNTVPTRRLQYDDGNSAGNAKVHTYDPIAVSNVTFSSSDSSGTLGVNLQLIGTTAVQNIAFPASGVTLIDDATQPFTHADSAGAVTVNGVVTLCQSVSISVDNGILTDRFFNSLTLVGFVKHDRNIRVSLTYPIGQAPDLYDASGFGVPVIVAYTNGTTVLTFTFPRVQFPKTPIDVPYRNELVHGLNGTAYGLNVSGTITEAMITALTIVP